MDLDMGISGSNLDFEEEVKFMKKIIVTKKKRIVPEKTEKNKDREKENRKVTVPKMKTSVEENVHKEGEKSDGEEKEIEEVPEGDRIKEREKETSPKTKYAAEPQPKKEGKV